MAADGYVTLERVREGEYLIVDDRTAPQFVVRCPSVCFFLHGIHLPATGRKGEGLFLLDWGLGASQLPPDFHSIAMGGTAQMIALESGDAVAVVPRPRIKEWLEASTRWDDNEDWSLLVPGRWLVTDYTISGTEHDDAEFVYLPPPGVVLGPNKIEWRVWS